MNDKHKDEMSDDVLFSLGFVKKVNSFLDEEAWTHTRGKGKFYYHILTADMVVEALINIGYCEFRRKAVAALDNIDMDD